MTDSRYNWFAAQFEHEMSAPEFSTTLILERLIDNDSDRFCPILDPDSSGEKVGIYKFPISIQAIQPLLSHRH